jgi:hypothetical protein
MPGKDKEQFAVKIAAMGRHFLYLPLFFAVHKNFFGYVSDNYNISLHFSAAIQSDADVFNYVLSRPRPANELRFGICDPMFIYHHSIAERGAGTEKPAIIAGVLNNSGFWAVDTRTEHFSNIQDLADVFESIICYGPGTTSHRIASHISTLASGKAIVLEQIAPNGELIDYKAKHLQATTAQKAMVLSPDILGIETLLRQDNRVRIELPIAATTEYAGNIVSAMISAEPVIANNEHYDLVKGIIAGTQAALLMVRAKHSEVMSFAADFFPDSANVESAIDNALDHGIFSSSVEIARAVWDRTTENSIAYFSDVAHTRGQVAQMSSVAYESFIAPHRRFWRDAITHVSQPIFGVLTGPRIPGFLDPIHFYIFLVLITVISLAVGAKFHNIQESMCRVAIESAVGLGVGLIVQRFASPINKLRCGYIAVFTLLALFLSYSVLGAETIDAGTVYLAIILAIVALPVTVSEKARSWVWSS